MPGHQTQLVLHWAAILQKIGAYSTHFENVRSISACA